MKQNKPQKKFCQERSIFSIALLKTCKQIIQLMLPTSLNRCI